MSPELLTVALIAGAANWAFRVLPTLARTETVDPDGWLGRFLAATGPAAIGTLFVASMLPLISPELRTLVPAVAGALAVVLVFLRVRSVVAATLFGALAHGLAFWLIG